MAISNVVPYFAILLFLVNQGFTLDPLPSIGALPLPVDYQTAVYLPQISFDLANTSITSGGNWTTTDINGAVKLASLYQLTLMGSVACGRLVSPSAVNSTTKNFRIEIGMHTNYLTNGSAKIGWFGLMISSSAMSFPASVSGGDNDSFYGLTGLALWQQLKPNGLIYGTYEPTILSNTTLVPGSPDATSSASCGNILDSSGSASYKIIVQSSQDYVSVAVSSASYGSAICFANVSMTGLGALIGGGILKLRIVGLFGNEGDVQVPNINIFELQPTQTTTSAPTTSTASTTTTTTGSTTTTSTTPTTSTSSSSTSGTLSTATISPSTTTLSTTTSSTEPPSTSTESTSSTTESTSSSSPSTMTSTEPSTSSTSTETTSGTVSDTSSTSPSTTTSVETSTSSTESPSTSTQSTSMSSSSPSTTTSSTETSTSSTESPSTSTESSTSSTTESTSSSSPSTMTSTETSTPSSTLTETTSSTVSDTSSTSSSTITSVETSASSTESPSTLAESSTSSTISDTSSSLQSTTTLVETSTSSTESPSTSTESTSTSPSTTASTSTSSTSASSTLAETTSSSTVSDTSSSTGSPSTETTTSTISMPLTSPASSATTGAADTSTATVQMSTAFMSSTSSQQPTSSAGTSSTVGSTTATNSVAMSSVGTSPASTLETTLETVPDTTTITPDTSSGSTTLTVNSTFETTVITDTTLSTNPISLETVPLETTLTIGNSVIENITMSNVSNSSASDTTSSSKLPDTTTTKSTAAALSGLTYDPVTQFPIPILIDGNCYPLVKQDDLIQCPYIQPDVRSPDLDTKVYFSFDIERLLSINDMTETISIWATVYLQWQVITCDSNYTASGVEEQERVLTPDTSTVWRPLMIFANSSSDVYIEGKDYGSKIQVMYVPTKPNRTLYFHWNRLGVLNSKCQLDLRMFPFDVQTCDFTFLLEEPIQFISFGGLYVESDRLNDNDNWHFLKATKEIGSTRSMTRHNGLSSYATTRLDFARNPLHYLINLLVPCYILVTLVFGSFLMSPNVPDRSVFCGTTLLALVVAQSDLLNDIPKTSQRILLADYILMLTGLTGAITMHDMAMCSIITGHPKANFQLVDLICCLPRMSLARACDVIAFLISLDFFIGINLYACFVAF